MFYEEKVVDGNLLYRTIPNGEWIPSNSQSATFLKSFATMSIRERMDALELLRDHFCLHCGGDDPYCQCWNDE